MLSRGEKGAHLFTCLFLGMAATSFLQNDSGAQDGQVDEQELMNSANKVQQGDSAHSNEIGQAAA